MQMFYHADLEEHSREINFSREESHHITKVLRRKAGDLIMITNGRGWIYTCELLSVERNACTAKVIETSKMAPPNYWLHMAVAPTKMNDRYEWFVEKATEIGIQEITPVFCDHSERKIIKMDRLERVIKSALKQSLSAYSPVMNDPVSLDDFLRRDLSGQKFIAHCEEQSEKKHLFDLIEKKQTINILIGPEGDFSPLEIEQAVGAGWLPVSLGDARLRTETAAIVACVAAATRNRKH